MENKLTNSSRSTKTEKSLIYIIFAGLTVSIGGSVFNYFYSGNTLDRFLELRNIMRIGLPIIAVFWFLMIKSYQNKKLRGLSYLFGIWTIILGVFWGKSILWGLGLIIQIGAVYILFANNKQKEESP